MRQRYPDDPLIPPKAFRIGACTVLGLAAFGIGSRAYIEESAIKESRINLGRISNLAERQEVIVLVGRLETYGSTSSKRDTTIHHYLTVYPKDGTKLKISVVEKFDGDQSSMFKREENVPAFVRGKIRKATKYEDYDYVISSDHPGEVKVSKFIFPR